MNDITFQNIIMKGEILYNKLSVPTIYVIWNNEWLTLDF